MDKQAKLHKVLSDLGRVVVAYSGGRDSAFLLKTAVDALGKDNVLAVTARSETYPMSEYKNSVRLAKSIGARRITINTRELELDAFRQNPVDRCYYCKKELFTKLCAIRDKYGMRYVADGTNLDDLKDIRHGTRAADELGVKRPLLEARISKKDIARLSKKLKLPTWNKPAMACLASRIPFGTPITKADLARIGKAEDFMRALGFTQTRVRLHGGVARLEVPRKEVALGVRLSKKIVNRLKKLGFIYITLDLEGYRTGSMHAAVLTLRQAQGRS
jgi:uncharacterized protein